MSTLCGRGVSSVASQIFIFMGDMILDSIDTLMMCYAIKKDNGADLQSGPMTAFYVLLEDKEKEAARVPAAAQ